MKFTMTERDILMGTLVDVGWYKLEITGNKDEVSAAGDSMNCVVDFKVIAHESGATKFQNVPLRTWFNSKAPGRWTPLLKAIGQNVAPGEFDIKDGALTGKTVMAMVVQASLDDGRRVNRIEDYKKA